jgi:hypothetical protein
MMTEHHYTYTRVAYYGTYHVDCCTLLHTPAHTPVHSVQYGTVLCSVRALSYGLLRYDTMGRLLALLVFTLSACRALVARPKTTRKHSFEHSFKAAFI